MEGERSPNEEFTWEEVYEEPHTQKTANEYSSVWVSILPQDNLT